VPKPRLRQNNPLHNKEARVYNRDGDGSGDGTDGDDDDDADPQRHNTSRTGRLLPSSAADGAGRRRQPLSAEGNENREALLGASLLRDDGEGRNRAKLGGGNADRRVRAGGDARNAPGMPWDSSGLNESNGLSSNNNGSTTPQGAVGKIPGEERRRGQRSSDSGRAQSSSGSASDQNPAEAARDRRRTGGKRNSWGRSPRETVEKRAARPITTATAADGTSRNTHRGHRGEKGGSRDSAAHLTREAAEKAEEADNGHSIASGVSNGDDRFARERPGDRYYLPPPQRNSRPRASPENTRSPNSSSSSNSPRSNEKRRSELQQGPSRDPREGERHQRQQRHQRKRSRAVSGRSGGGRGEGGDNADSSSSVQSRRREGRRSSASDRLYPQQAADHRPMLGVSEAPGASNMPDWRYGWRGPFTATSSAQSQEEGSLPYYVDRKQVCVRASVRGDRAETLAMQQ